MSKPAASMRDIQYARTNRAMFLRLKAQGRLPRWFLKEMDSQPIEIDDVQAQPTGGPGQAPAVLTNADLQAIKQIITEALADADPDDDIAKATIQPDGSLLIGQAPRRGLTTAALVRVSKGQGKLKAIARGYGGEAEDQLTAFQHWLDGLSQQQLKTMRVENKILDIAMAINPKTEDLTPQQRAAYQKAFAGTGVECFKDPYDVIAERTNR